MSGISIRDIELYISAWLEEDVLLASASAYADGDAVVSLVLFDNEPEVLIDRIPIGCVKPLTEADYRVGGCTALLDAVGGSVKFIERVQKYLPGEHRPG